ncbi:hypothetical protein B0A55_02051 [Friedmanniomyces simplex]|uniref:Uncharacterized protein n=1 Tax=Friedmanniomyces simplex TaxID=329884 RepID=A0A4U0Y082_9PEZI|nr:hypothetical protein B0A55_02051 [Friedmanniomyces simplex]
MTTLPRPIAVINELNHELSKLIEEHCKRTRHVVLPHPGLEASANELCDSIGPRMWPEPEDDLKRDRFQWLANASEDTLGGLYPRDLFYARAEDRQQLQESFFDLGVARYLVYMAKHPQAPPPGRKSREREVSTPTSFPSGEDEQDEQTDSSFNPKSARASLVAPTSNPFPKTRPSGGARKRRGLTMEASGAKGGLQDGLVSPPSLQSLVVVLKLTPHQLRRVATEEAGMQGLHEGSAPSKGARGLGSAPTVRLEGTAKEHSEPVSDANMLGRQHRERARAFHSLSVSKLTTVAIGSGNGKEPMRPVRQESPPRDAESERGEDEGPSAASPEEGFHYIGSGSYQKGPPPDTPQRTPDRRPFRESAPLVTHATTNAAVTKALPNTHADAKRSLMGLPSPPASGPAIDLQDHRASLKPDSIPVLERIVTEIDWASPDQFPSFVPLDSGYTVEDLFARIDEQVPPMLEQQRAIAVRVQHLNYGGAGRNVSCRIVRVGPGGSRTFDVMLGWLKRSDAEAVPELKVTVEWSS